MRMTNGGTVRLEEGGSEMLMLHEDQALVSIDLGGLDYLTTRFPSSVHGPFACTVENPHGFF